MSPSLVRSLALVALWAAAAALAPAAENSPALDSLQGKWSTTRTNRNGRLSHQVIEIKKDQLVFQLLGEDQQLRLFAKGTVKAEKAGPFDILTLSNIQGGRSAEELEAVDDNRDMVFALREGQLVLASNFDRERPNERPAVDIYSRVESAKATDRAGGDSESKLLGTWKAEVNLADNKRDYELRIGKADGKLEATLISPRSGEHKFKTAAYQAGELVMELEREIDGNNLTLVYRGKLTADGLSGTMAVKGHEDQYSGQWKATK